MNTIDQFEAFVEFISNIDQQKATVAAMKETTQQWQDAQAALSKGQTLAVWETSLQAKADKLASDTASSQTALDERARQLDDRAEALDVREGKLNVVDTVQKQRDQSLADLAKQLDTQAQDLSKKQANLDAQIAIYNQLKADLDAKQVALSQVFK